MLAGAARSQHDETRGVFMLAARNRTYYPRCRQINLGVCSLMSYAMMAEKAYLQQVIPMG